MNWFDSFLKWNTSNSLIVPTYKIWMPDLELYNAAADPQEYESINSVYVYPDGSFFLINPLFIHFHAH